MPRLQISVSTVDFQQDIKTALHTAMSMGATGVQLDLRQEVNARDYGETARRQLLHYLQERSLQIGSAAFPLRGSIAEPDRLDERTHAVRTAVTLAGQLKIRRLCLRIGRLPDPENPKDWSQVRDVMNDLTAHADRSGVILCLKPSGDPPDRLKHFCEVVAQGWLGVDADPGGWILNRQNPVEQLRELHGRIQHVEVRDAVREIDGLGKEVPMGRGEVDWDEVAAILGEMDYQGWFNVTRTSGADPVTDMSRAIVYLRNLMPWEA